MLIAIDMRSLYIFIECTEELPMVPVCEQLQNTLTILTPNDADGTNCTNTLAALHNTTSTNVQNDIIYTCW